MQNQGKIKVLDGLRGYAALLVLVVHFPQVTNTKLGELIKYASLKMQLGYIGVDIFFVLSGFLITRILLREKNNNTFSFKQFYLKRALRIFPIYYLSIFLVAILITPQFLPALATYTSNYLFSFEAAAHPMRHTWSLAVEEHFYLLFPLLVFSIKIKYLKPLLQIGIPFLLILSLFFTYSFFEANIAKELTLRATHIRFLTLGIGCYFACIETKISTISLKKYWLLLGVLCLVYPIGVFAHYMPFYPYVPLEIIKFFAYGISAALVFILVLNLENSKSKIKQLFTNRKIAFTGLISYGLYLYHYPILYAFNMTNDQIQGNSVSLSKAFGVLFFIFLVTILSYFLVEKPLLKIKNRLQ